jgi:DNA-binding HxlR family transcriptional regulator
MSTDELIRLFHHRWSAPVLAELERERGARFVLLANRLRVGRESLARTLEALIELGLARRNPGYGHPLRPEYLLTERGAEVAPSCRRLVAALEELGAADVGLKKWSMPVLLVLGREERFSGLRSRLPAISPRALALALKELAAAGLVLRRVTDDFPPATVYAPTPRSRPLLAALRGLAA